MTPLVAVVDDSTLVRESLVSLMPRLQDGGRYATVEAFLAQGRPVDLVVLDLRLVNADQPQVRQGVAGVRAVVAAGYRVCVYTQDERPYVLAACLAVGACGVVDKSASLPDAQDCFCAAAAGEVVVPASLLGVVEVLLRRRSITVLGPRQRQVLAGRARGQTYAQMSRRLHLSESTLRGYWRDLTEHLSQLLQERTPHEMEQALGLGPGDLLDQWPPPPPTPPPPAAARSQDWWSL